MRKRLPLFLLLALTFSCKKNAEHETQKLKDTLRIIDSINAVRTKYNDSIRILNHNNIYKDLSGSHKFTHSEIGKSGNVNFKKIGRDEYEISGNIKLNDNYVEIKGIGELVTEKYLNFDGKIIQKINGTPYERTKKTSFTNEGKGSFWRLQNKVNGDGFVDYIDIHF